MTPTTLAIAVLYLAASAVFFFRWRFGVAGTLALGFLIDPLRKLVEGGPVWLSALVVLPVLGTLLGAARSGVRLSLRRAFGLTSALYVPSVLFLLLVVAQSFNAYARTGSPVIAAIGLLAYLSPLPGILLGFYYARGTADVSRVFKVYVGLTLFMTLGVYLAVLGFSGRLLSPVGSALYSYTGGVATQLQSGLFRAPEIAAWHIAVAACLVLLLAFTRLKSAALPYLLVVLVPFLVGAAVFTGRRKSIVVVVLFLAVYFTFAFMYNKGATRVLGVLVALAGLAFGALTFTNLSEFFDVRPYFSRGQSMGAGMSFERIERNWFTVVEWVIERNGVLGAGAGTGSQGAQYFGGGAALVGGNAEGGIGKVIAELGVPGLALLIWLGLAGAYHFWRVARAASRGGPRKARYAYGLIALLAANAFIFTIGHQVFGDPFVLYVLGLMIGFALATPGIVQGRVIQRVRLDDTAWERGGPPEGAPVGSPTP